MGGIEREIEMDINVTLPNTEIDKTKEKYSFIVNNLNVWYGANKVIHNINMQIREKAITAVMGPSGCGKSTFIRCLNRMHEVIPNARISGGVLLDGQNIYEPSVDIVDIRRKVGMVFQKANPFPTLTVYNNVAVGLRLIGGYTKIEIAERVEKSLRQSALWEEVKDRLNVSATKLSGGQQQRLCIARALAVEPGILLLDEPCSALDPTATARIEELLLELKKSYTLMIVTHNMQQAARVSDYTAFLLMGELVEFGVTSNVFTAPKDKRTEQYITGRFG